MVQKKRLAAKIKSQAAAQNKSISALERYAGCSQGLISRWAAAAEEEEFGVLSKLSAMADYLELSLDQLLDREERGQACMGSTDPICRLLELTMSHDVQWVKLEAENELQLNPEDIPPAKSGRMYSEAWWLLQNGCYFVLASYCDDQSDVSEPIELDVYCVLGHGFPIYPLAGAEPSVLRELYIQLRIQQALGIAAGQSDDI